ncbi:MAG: hypothetical protein ABI591_17285 [Kofleriaceae bacterium]
MRLLSIAALVWIGCGHAPPTSPETGPSHATGSATPRAPDAPVALDDDLDRLAELSTRMYQAIAKVLGEPSTAPHDGDCAAVAAKLDAITHDDAEVIAANAKVLHAGHPKIQALKTALEPHQAELDAAAQTIGASQTMKTCSSDPAFEKATDRLLGEP